MARSLTMTLTLATTLLATGCGSDTPTPFVCEDDRECWSELGGVSVCTAAATCEALEVPAGCELTGPLSFSSIDASEELEQSVVLGALEAPGHSTLAVEAVVAASSDTMLPATSLFSCRYASHDEAKDQIDFLVRASVPGIVLTAPSGDTDAIMTHIDTSGYDLAVLSPNTLSASLQSAAGEPVAPSDEGPGRLWQFAPDATAVGASMARLLVAEIPDTTAPVTVTVITAPGVGVELLGAFDDALGDSVDLTRVDVLLPDTFAPVVDGEAAEAHVRDALSSGPTDWVVFLAEGSASYEALRRVIVEDEAATDGVWGGTRFLLGPDAAYPGATDDMDPDLLDSADFGTPTAWNIVVPQAANDVEPWMVAANLFAPERICTPWAFDAHTFDASWLLVFAAQASAAAGEVSGVEVRRALRHMQSGTVVALNSQGWRAADSIVRADGSLDVEGVSGSLDFDLTTELLAEDSYAFSVVVAGADGCLYQGAEIP